MARPTQIKDGIKVTLYMPSKLVEYAKEYAENEELSLSKLVSECLQKRMSGNTTYRVDICPNTDLKLKARASREGITVEELIATIAQK